MILDEDLYSSRDYLAPTVFKKAGLQINAGWNFYNSKADVINKFYYLLGRSTVNVDPIGQVSFTPDTNAQTMGINVDFYIFDGQDFTITSYKYLRSNLNQKGIIFRFFTTDGNGPYWAIFDINSFGISATPITATSPEKIAALDAYYREVQILKYSYNSLVGFLNTLAQKQLSPAEQQIYNEGNLRLQNMQQQINSLQGLDITYTSTGAVIGIAPLVIIAIVAILAIVTAWAITDIYDMQQKTKQINDAYNLSEWIATKKTQLAQMVNAGQLTQKQADDINAGLDKSQATANKIAANAASPSTTLSSLVSILKWGVIGFLGIKTFELIKTKN